MHASSQQAQRHGAGVGAPVQAQARVGNPTAQTDQPQVRVQTLKVRTGVGSGTHGQAGDGGQTQTIRSQAHRTITLRSLKAHQIITLRSQAHRTITLRSLKAHQIITLLSQAHRTITLRSQAHRTTTITLQCHAHRTITIMKRSQAHQNITIRGQAQTITIQATRSLQHQERS